MARVIEILQPLVHPPRIADPKLLLEARRLLGITLHIQGDVPAAREEFGAVLLGEPDLELDAFVVPPRVIETFESVRREMGPVLDRVRAAKKAAKDPVGELPPPPSDVAPHRLLAFLPVGIAQFSVLDQPEWGAAWAALQLVGLAVNIGAYWSAQAQKPLGNDQEKVDAFNRFVNVQYAGLGLLAAGYAGSAIQANVAISSWRPETAPPPPPPAGAASFVLDFSF
jgi:hypothetical protein